jgi:hypothetical protein
MNDHSTAAQLIALGALAVLTVIMLLVRRKVALALKSKSYETTAGATRQLSPGEVIPLADLGLLLPGDFRVVSVSLFRPLLVGKDNRVSTSKSVVLAWTYAVLFGLVSLIVAKWLGSPAGYNHLIKTGLQDEYLLFLGGPLAAGVLAKYKATSDAHGASGKSVAPLGSASPTQLISDDSGDTDIGDFQYVAFNVLALVYYLGTFIPHLSDGMPNLPQLLTGLALTSAAGYTGKQLIGRAAPVLTALHSQSAPRSRPPDRSSVQIWGRNLIVPASASPDGSAVAPIVDIGGQPAVVTAISQPLGVDCLTVTVPANAVLGPVKVVVMRADGVPAAGPGGSDGLTLTVTDPSS